MAAQDKPRISSEERTREVIQKQAKAMRDHAEQTGGKVMTQEQAEKIQRQICEQQDKQNEERRRK